MTKLSYFQARSFDDDFDSDPEPEEVTPEKQKSINNKKDDDDEDSDFDDPDLIEVPGGGKSLETIQNLKSGNAAASMPSFGGLGDLPGSKMFF